MCRRLDPNQAPPTMVESSMSKRRLEQRFLTRLLQMFSAERVRLLRLGVMALSGAAFGLALPYTTGLTLDKALPDGAPRLLVVVALATVILVGHQCWMTWLQALTRIELGMCLERRSLREIMRALVRSEYGALRRRDGGWMLTTLAGARTVVDAYVAAFVALLTQGAFGLTYLVVLAQASPSVAVVVLVSSVLIALTSYGLARLEAHHTRSLLDRESAQYQLLHTLMGGLAALRALRATERLGNLWSRRVCETGSAQANAARASVLQSTVHSTCSHALNTGILIWATHQCLNAELSIGMMMFMITASNGLAAAVAAVVGIFAMHQGLRPHLERIDAVLTDAGLARALPAEPIQTADQIRVENVWYRYDNGRWVLEAHNWEISRGKVGRIDAPSGSGKSTLLRLLAGLVAPERGRVTIFGVDAGRARQLVLYVPQHCKLFEASVRENLALLSGESHERIAQVAALTGLDRMLSGFPMGEETLVAADGSNLSSGQRQLIVLTAAFASSRPVLLLDEATSQIDAATHARCQWDALFRGRTVVCVEHG
jgi:ABC-type bacteriocin/lantibiotic exporter with double-glycine peptidase domain